MDNDHQPTTIIEESPAQKTLAKIDGRDRVVRMVEIAILAIVVAFNVFTGVRLQNQIEANNKATITAREQNITRQTEIKDYIKCLSLLKFTVPAPDLTTKEGVSKALDACAANN
jgi:Na+/H+ antiporter NhaC